MPLPDRNEARLLIPERAMPMSVPGTQGIVLHNECLALLGKASSLQVKLFVLGCGSCAS